jgi:transposase
MLWTNTCGECPHKRDCTAGKERRARPAMQLRGETGEHSSGTIKAWMGATHFEMKTLQHVGTEMALHVLACNIKRVIAILRVPGLVETITAFLPLLAVTIWGLRSAQGLEGPQSTRAGR